MDKLHVLGICATKNRVTHLTKVIRCFLEQDYEGESTLLIYNNAKEPQELGEFDIPTNKRIIVVNQSTKIGQERDYNNLGEIYNDILEHIKVFNIVLRFDLVTHMDDDDTYLPDHFSEGVEGFKRGGLLAYKPEKSWFKTHDKLTLEKNVLEPSIFVDYHYLVSEGYFNRNVDLHHKWVQPLVDNEKFYVDPKGKATFIYDWSGTITVWKTSGDPNNPENFTNYEKNSKDCGTGILLPMTKEDLLKYEPKYNMLYGK